MNNNPYLKWVAVWSAYLRMRDSFVWLSWKITQWQSRNQWCCSSSTTRGARILNILWIVADANILIPIPPPHPPQICTALATKQRLNKEKPTHINITISPVFSFCVVCRRLASQARPSSTYTLLALPKYC